MKKVRSYFWLRLASTIIDLSIIYCLSVIFQFVLFKFTFARLCDIFVCVFGVYYTVSYIVLKGRSPAKLLTGLKIIHSDGGDIQLKNILLREIAFKLVIGIIIPSYILQLIFPIWSFLITLLLAIVILILSSILLLIFRRSWWELFSQSTTIKIPVTQRSTKSYMFLSFTVITFFALIIIVKPVYHNVGKLRTTFYPEYPVTHETIRYADFIKSKSKDPTDYVFDLFKKYDLVVLSERIHPEYTQYELIFNIIHDKRFVKDIGNIFTEIGSVSFQDTLNTYLHTSFKNEDELNKSTAILQRNSDGVHPIWDCTNHFDLLKQVNLLNSKLPDSSKINWFFSDLPVNWETMTRNNYLKGYTPLKRDSIMAINILNKYKNIVLKGQRKKALIILNTIHGYGILNRKAATGVRWLDLAATNYLMKALPGKVANVMLNTASYIFTPIQYGKWETAFKIAGNPNVGFNFEGSPFGDDKWDSFFLTPKSFTYKDVFTGFIFYKPLNQQISKRGFPYEYEKFQDTLLRRAACVDANEVKKDQIFIKQYNNDPKSILESGHTPYGPFFNGLNIIFFPFLIIMSYLLSLIFFVRKVKK